MASLSIFLASSFLFPLSVVRIPATDSLQIYIAELFFLPRPLPNPDLKPAKSKDKNKNKRISPRVEKTGPD
ncbi:hypothetical protein F5X99DRAFT_365474 [Biscogniauxia marginata]|nr:hypothetical protein F5X99DRAFT_365474 [Biscogniauxia marginata]